MSIPYRFVPWARRGLARAHANPDAADAALATRPRIKVGLTLQAKQDGAVAAAVSGNIDLTLYGPADIIGIDHRLIVRTDPRPDATNFEPNYLAIVDFDPPDFPWLLTPAHANATGHLRPWLVLVVVERAKVALPALRAGRPLPSISLTAQQVVTELPDLAESWLWAHSQAISTVNAADPGAAQTLSTEMRQLPERNISRLVCPRRLTPRTDYVACVVPATEGGRLRGLGQPVAGDTLGTAWSRQAPNDVELPVYFSWTFSTGPVGDVETLARRLRTPAQYGGDAELLAQLHHIGERPVYVDGDHLLFNGTTPGRTVFEGAMVSLGFTPEASSALYAGKLQEILNSGSTRVATGAAAADHVPTLAPPIYGEYPAKRHTVASAKVNQHWLDGLSLQPRYRLVAGWGAEVVRQNQDEFMQAAWEQLGDVLAAERAFSLARLARDVLKRVEVRHWSKLAPDRVLAVMAPARARVAIAAGESLYGRMAGATLPQELFDGSMRRLVSPRRATFKMARWRERDLARPTVTAQMAALVNDFAHATTRLAAIDPNEFVPDGLLGSRSFDRVPLPANPAAEVDLTPYTGYALRLTGRQIQAIQSANAAARKLAAITERTVPSMGDVWRRGLLTETHAIRVAELQSVARVPLTADVGDLIRRVSTRGTEGVLLSVQPHGALAAQALRIDGRSGALRTVGRPLVATQGGNAGRAAAVTRAAIATVPITALKLYGNTAVFTTLPPSTLSATGTKVSIGLRGPGDFSKVPRPSRDATPTITLPPAVKDRATLERYSAALDDYRKVILPPADSRVVVQAVDFATATSAAQSRARLDADRTVPARLASSLSLGAQPVALAGGALSNVFISASLDAAIVDVLRYVVPQTFDRVMAFPKLPFPLSRKLETLAPDVFLPGVGVLPDDFIMAVQTNPRFVEALLVGANHEMGREMLWQGLPTDQRGTPFQHFWQRLDGKADIEFIHQWHAVPLGTQPGNTAMLVLLIRGQLLVRVPNLNIYAYPIVDKEKRPGGVNPPDDGTSEMDPGKVVPAVLRGQLGRDITYVGFPIAPGDIGKYFFVIEEHMTEPRFGFDERVGAGQNSSSWLDVDWDDIAVANGSYFGLTALRKAQPATGPQWVDPHAATVADAALQRPFRGYWRGDALKTP
ncbi:MAG TPA: hypothetical protein VET86_10990 [Casimicrobiaceae bacterium]|nr:hypothetical protein [Casimicrobiaceae bacterium]